MQNFLIECSSKIVKLSVEISVKEIKPVVIEKHDFEYRDETLLVALIGIFAIS